MWLDFEGEFTKLWPQPFVICFPPDVQGAVSHSPDFLGATDDGRLTPFDVRPARRIDDRARRQFELTAEVCETLGWPYQVLSGRDEVATGNLEWLKASRHTRCAPPADAVERILATACDGATRAEVLATAAPERRSAPTSGLITSPGIDAHHRSQDRRELLAGLVRRPRGLRLGGSRRLHP